jgi:putative transposase
MSRPSRKSYSAAIPSTPRTYFVSSMTAQRRALLQTEAMANLFIDVLRRYTLAGQFKVHEFVVMRNHFHVLLTVKEGMTLEKAVQMIKGNFSFRAKKELGMPWEIWQKGFSDVRITDRESYSRHVTYIDENPVKAGYARSAEEYPYCSAYFRRLKRQKNEKS